MEALKEIPFFSLPKILGYFSGTIEVDETYLGGQWKNKENQFEIKKQNMGEGLGNRYIRFVEISFRLIRDTLISCSLTPIRTRKHKRISVYYRRLMEKSFDPDKYYQRNKVEPMFTVLKRKFGESLKARKYQI